MIGYAYAHRRLWQTLSYAMAGFSLIEGADFIVLGNTQVYSPSLDVLSRAPGHMHTFGWIMFVLGCWLIFETVRVDNQKLHNGLRAFFGFSLLVTTTLFGSWWTTGLIVLQSPWYWVLIACFSGGLLRYPPPPKSLLRGRDHV